MLLNKVYICHLHLFVVLSPHCCCLFFSAQNQVKIFFPTQREQSLVLIADVLLLCSQTQLLYVRVCAEGQAHAPHRWLGYDGEGAIISQTEAAVGSRCRGEGVFVG